MSFHHLNGSITAEVTQDFVAYVNVDDTPLGFSSADPAAIAGLKVDAGLPGVISALGDVNGDGFDDFAFADPADGGNDAGRAYVVFGSADGLAGDLDPTDLAPGEGFEIATGIADDALGISIDDAGDINGDGFDDIVVGATGVTSTYTQTYVRYDGYTRFYSTYIPITYTYTYFGYTYSGATYTEQRTYQGGYTYFGSYYYGTAITYTYTYTRPDAGAAYVIFGSAAPVDVDPATNRMAATEILGPTSNADFGLNVVGVGDVSGDGFDDVAVARGNSPYDATSQVFVIWSSAIDSVRGKVDVSRNYDSAHRLYQTFQEDVGFGESMDGGADINGDGFGDLVIGAALGDGRETYTYTSSNTYFYSIATYVSFTYTYVYVGYTTNGATYTDPRVYTGSYLTYIPYTGTYTATYTGSTAVADAGQAYILFGAPPFSGGSVNVDSLDRFDGLTFSGSMAGDQVGASVAMAGDVNGDRMQDAIIGAPGVDGGAGAAYVVHGFAGPSDRANLQAADLVGGRGFAITSDGLGTGLGRTVAALGDIGGGQFDDFAVVDSIADGAGFTGRLHVIFGQNGGALDGGISIGALNGTNGYTFLSHGHGAAGDFATSVQTGDFNGDGMTDILIGDADGSGLVITADMPVWFQLDRMDNTLDGQIDLGLFLGPNVIGTSGDDMLSGDIFANSLFGFGGDDILRGRANDDLLNGGGDDDTLLGGTGDDTLLGGRGADRGHGGSGADTILGGAGVDSLFGGAGEDTIRGGLGGDTIRGGEGRDRLFGDNADDFIFGGGMLDVIHGGTGNDTIDGGSGSDRIHGGDGDDMLTGGTGKDRIWDGDGSDTMIGGLGDDTFVLALDGDRDVIDAFEDMADLIDVTGWGATAGSLAYDFRAPDLVVVTFGSEELWVQSAAGLNATNFTDDDFIFTFVI